MRPALARGGDAAGDTFGGFGNDDVCSSEQISPRRTATFEIYGPGNSVGDEIVLIGFEAADVKLKQVDAGVQIRLALGNANYAFVTVEDMAVADVADALVFF